MTPCQSDLCFSIVGAEAKGRYWSYILRLPDNEICDSFLRVTVILPPSPSLICTTKFTAGEFLYMVMWTSQNSISTFEFTLSYCPYSWCMQCLQIFSCPCPAQHASLHCCTLSQNAEFFKQLLKQFGTQWHYVTTCLPSSSPIFTNTHSCL